MKPEGQRRLFRYCWRIWPSRHKQIRFSTKFDGCGNCTPRTCRQLTRDVLGDNQCAHQITPATFFNFSTSSDTEPTLIPALRT